MASLFGDRAGAVSLTTAIMAVVMVGMAGLAVDVGAVFQQTRQLQGVADIAAMAAAQDIANADARARRAMVINGEDAALAVELGGYAPDPSVPPQARFRSGADSPNAVRVRLQERVPLFFGAMFVPGGAMTISRNATASQARLAAFQLGSRALAVKGGVENKLLSALTGSTISLTALDYNALATANVDLFAYMDSLRTRAHAQGATFNSVLTGEVDPPQAIGAIGDALNASGDQRAADAIATIADAARALPRSPSLSALYDLGPYGAQSVASAGEERRIEVNALDLATATLELANGRRMVQFDLGASVPGLANTKAWLAIGARPSASPWLAVTADGSPTIHTAQVRLLLQADVGAGAVASVRVPVFVEIASAAAHLSEIRCGADQTVTIAAAPSLGTIALASVDLSGLADFASPLRTAPASLLKTPLLQVNGYARADIGGDDWQSVSFTRNEIANGAVKTVDTTNVASGTLSSLVDNLQVTATPTGLSLTTPALARDAVAAAATPLDDLVNTLTGALGVHLGQADIRVNGLRCNGVALVG